MESLSVVIHVHTVNMVKNDPPSDIGRYGVNTVHINYIQQCNQYYLLLTSKFYVFNIYKLTFCDHAESLRHLL